jgi:hypothetical protein
MHQRRDGLCPACQQELDPEVSVRTNRTTELLNSWVTGALAGWLITTWL